MLGGRQCHAKALQGAIAWGFGAGLMMRVCSGNQWQLTDGIVSARLGRSMEVGCGTSF